MRFRNFFFWAKLNPILFNSVTLLANGPVMIWGDKIQINAIVRTPDSLSFFPKRATSQGFRLAPLQFSFPSICGPILDSTSLYVSADIDFTTGHYTMMWQSAELTTVNSLNLGRSPSYADDFLEGHRDNYLH